ncbi:MAG: AMP-binding protein, partial [bacterium]|nr:AMP-binding protein [bacterium]
YPAETPEVDSHPDDLVYMIYTSGTTGKPKGVMVEHRNVVNTVTGFAKYYDITMGSQMALLSEITFDASVDQVFGSLLYGATLHVITKERLLSIENLRRYIREKQVGIINFVPSFIKELLAGEEKLDSLQTVISGAESLDEKTKTKILEKGYRLYNHYGPTEGTVDALVARCREEAPVTLGQPIANVRSYILDGSLNLVPPGVAGELFITGDSLARGYLNRPELTAEEFPENIFNPGERMYGTGDLTKRQHGGEILFLGRKDHQVKIRGYRIELEEIQNRILEYEKIREAVVIAIDGSEGEHYICAYIVLQKAPTVETGTTETVKPVISVQHIQEYLRERLPQYMLPAYISIIDKMPLLPNGKIDKKALSDLDISTLKTQKQYTPPRNEAEKKLTALWAGILEMEENALGIDDNFFEMGGHSLKATMLISAIGKEMEIELPLAEVFKTPTIRGLAASLEETGTAIQFETIEKAPQQETYPLSSVQRRMYMAQVTSPGNTSYNLPVVVEIEGRLERERLEEIIQQIINRHESFRTSFELSGMNPVQRIVEHVGFRVEYYEAINEAAAKDATGKELEITRITNDFVRPFDLSKPPAMRLGLVKTAENKHLLMLDMHHIISDGMSMNVFLSEFAAFYAGGPLPPLPLQYKDFVMWQLDGERIQAIKEQAAYWKEQFREPAPILQLPLDHARPPVKSFQGKSHYFNIAESQTRVLKELAAEEGATYFMVLLALYNVFLAKMTRQEDILVGTSIAGRRHANLNSIIGMFVNALVLRNYPQPGKPFNTFLNELKTATLGAYENQDFPFEDLVEIVGGKRDTSRNPIFDTMFVMNNEEDPEEFRTTRLTVKPYAGYHHKSAQMDLKMRTREE